MENIITIPTHRQIAAFPCCTTRISIQHASRGIAASVVAMLRQTAVALFPGFDEPVSANRAVEQRRRLILQAIVHPVGKRQQQVVQTTGGPVGGRHRRTARRHDAAVVRTRALVGVVLHAEVVAHFVGHRRGHESHDRRVVGVHPAGVLVGADGAFERFSDDPVFEIEFAANGKVRWVRCGG